MVAKKSVVKDETKEITFTYREVECVVPAPKLWPLEVVEAQEAGQNMKALRELVGEEQWKPLRKVLKTLGDLDECMEELFKAVEVEMGE